MKTIVLYLALLIPSVLSAAPVSTPSKTDSPSKHAEIIELYSIYCGGCFYWEKHMIPELTAKLQEKNITLKQAHMPFGGKFSKEASIALAMTEGTPLYSKVKAELFQRIHVDRKGGLAF